MAHGSARSERDGWMDDNTRGLSLAAAAEWDEAAEAFAAAADVLARRAPDVSSHDALALILPIVTTFFLAFGVLEDSGYFSRLSVIANRMFAAIGLNGRAVLPMVLGLGCVTMATLTTRILHTPRERLITIYLMALAIPCSAQLGVVLGLLGGISFVATVIWVACIVGVLLFTGWLASKVVPGKRAPAPVSPVANNFP